MRIQLKDSGPIAHADIDYGDFTIFVGPQAVGKSIFLQFSKLVMDTPAIVKTLKSYGYQWEKELSPFLTAFFGEGMEKLITEKSQLIVNDKPFALKEKISRAGSGKEKTIYIPAQRVLTVSDEWPRPFGSYSPGYPYVLKSFSEWIRTLMNTHTSQKGGKVFPKTNSFKKPLREFLVRSIFRDGYIAMEHGVRKRMLLRTDKLDLPFMSWSSGQKEFVLLLLALQWLSPASKTPKKADIEWVIIEEPEMGLHPEAIQAVFLAILELVHRGYRVIISTHSSNIVELAWVLTEICSLDSQFDKRKEALLAKMFDLKSDPQTRPIFNSIIKKTIKTYFFKPSDTGVRTIDISTLDPGSEETSESGWGGLLASSTKANDIVSELWSMR